MGVPSVTVEQLSKRFATAEAGVTAVEAFTFDVAEGEFVSLIGPSGRGKSTLFQIIGGPTGDYQGRVTVTGPHPAVGRVFQEESTFPWRNVLDNVAFPLEPRGVSRAEPLERASHYVAMVGPRGCERRYPAELSGGMRQCVAMAVPAAMNGSGSTWRAASRPVKGDDARNGGRDRD